LIYVRSRRPILTLAACAVACAVAFAGLAFAAFQLPMGWIFALSLGAVSAAAVVVAAWAGVQLRAWPTGRLGLFRDRLLIVHDRHEMRALWDHMEIVTLADEAAWPNIRMTDCLTLHLRHEPPVRFKPADFGLEAGSCRDLILRLRDDRELRGRLPEFDSVRDLTAAPVVAGEMSDTGL
jgi:hypothetical protein